MKLSEIHNGLENQNIREMLSKKIGDLVFNLPQKIQVDNKLYILDWSIKNEEAEIAYHTELLNKTKEKQACRLLIKMMGWEEYDVSDYTQLDLPNWINFIGTENEYHNLLKQLNV